VRARRARRRVAAAAPTRTAAATPNAEAGGGAEVFGVLIGTGGMMPERGGEPWPDPDVAAALRVMAHGAVSRQPEACRLKAISVLLAPTSRV
jgi:hypothetical protein